MTRVAPDLTILCVTDWGLHATEFLTAQATLAREINARYVVALDGPRAMEKWYSHEIAASVVGVTSTGYIESVLDDAVTACETDYVLRLDDDETVTHALRDWLSDGGYREREHWAFPRLHLYPSKDFYITTPPLYPDYQTRLSLKQYSGNRTVIHEGSPYGTGEIGPAGIVHHKFIARPLAERRAVLTRYEQIRPGAGADFRMFSVPEDYEAELAWQRSEGSL